MAVRFLVFFFLFFSTPPPHSFFWVLPLSSSLVRLSTPRRETVRHLDELRMRTETGRWWFDPILTESIAALKDLGRDLCRRLKSLSVVARVRTVIALTASSLLLLLMVFYPVSGFFFFWRTNSTCNFTQRTVCHADSVSCLLGLPSAALSEGDVFTASFIEEATFFFFCMCVSYADTA